MSIYNFNAANQLAQTKFISSANKGPNPQNFEISHAQPYVMKKLYENDMVKRIMDPRAEIDSYLDIVGPG